MPDKIVPDLDRSVLSEEELSPDELLDNRAVFFFYGLTRQALYDARKRGRLQPVGYGKHGFIYRVRDLRAYRDSIDPRARHASPMYQGKP